jgi:hypothetical protein
MPDDPTATAAQPTPDHVACRHDCGVTISWDQFCWTHDDTGLAECGIRILGGTPVGDALLDPAMIRTRKPQTRAEPVGAWS